MYRRPGSDGRIKSVLDDGKCLAFGKEWFEAGERSPGQPWHRRDLGLSRCSASDAARQVWRLAPIAG
jgi:hypothetical protein